jgi:transposase
MNAAPEPLPNNVAALRAMLVEAWAERDAERAENARLASQNDRLRHLIHQLQHLQFGRRSERLDPDQLNLALADLEQAVAETETQQEKADPVLRRARAEKRRAVRGSLPEHPPRVEIVVEPEDTAWSCCGDAMQVIGEDRSQRLDIIPAQYRVVVTRRPKYACRKCQEGVIQATSAFVTFATEPGRASKAMMPLIVSSTVPPSKKVMTTLRPVRGSIVPHRIASESCGVE